MAQGQFVAQQLIERYAGAVNANDVRPYRELFTEDAVRSPPGTDLEFGPEAIAKGETSTRSTSR